MYTLGKYTEHQRKNWAQSKRIIIYESESQLLDFIRHAKKNSKPPNKKMYFGTIPEDLAKRIKKDTGAEVKGYNVSISEDEIRKIFISHGKEAKEAPRGHRAITEADIASIPKIIQNPDRIALSSKLRKGKPVIHFVKTINGRTTVVSYVSDRHSDLIVQTMYSGKNKDGTLALLTDELTPDRTSETGKGTGSATNNIQKSKPGKMGGKRKRLVFAGTGRPIPDISKTNIFKTSAEGESEEAKPIPARLLVRYFDAKTKKIDFFESGDIANFSIERTDGRFYLRTGQTLTELAFNSFGSGWAANTGNSWVNYAEPSHSKKFMRFNIFTREPVHIDFSKKNNFKIDKSIYLDPSYWEKNNA